MGSFFNMDKSRERGSNYERALLKLEENKPQIGTDTQEKDGRYFLYSMEVSKDEYEKFLDQYQQIMDLEIQDKEMKLAA